jgi:3-hydroxybutyryl-CoA dehydratase
MIFNEGQTYFESIIISDKIHQGFIDLFKDGNPLHTDTNYAIIHGFKGKVMHGNILNGFISYFIGECLPTQDVIIHTQEIQFKKPVYLNDILKFRAVVKGVYESVNAIEFNFEFKNETEIIVAKGKIQIGLLK